MTESMENTEKLSVGRRGEGHAVNGASTDASNNTAIDPAKLAELRQRSALLHAAIGEAVSLLARDTRWRHASLADLEWLLLPPLMSGQLVTLRAKVKNAEGVLLPLALGLWAKVSPEVDAKLEAQRAVGLQPRLAPQDWTSGSIPWLVVNVGPKELLPRLQEQLSETLGDRMKVF